MMDKAVFLDRDGTINVDRHYIYKIEDFEYKEGVISGLRELSELGFILVIITNQSGIYRGYYTEEDYLKLNEWIVGNLAEHGVPLAGTYYCPHGPGSGCNCRKPKTGLFWQAANELGIDMDHSFAIGDRLRDLSIVEESGVTGILLTDSHGGPEAPLQGRIYKCVSFKGAAELIKELDRDERCSKESDM